MSTPLDPDVVVREFLLTPYGDTLDQLLRGKHVWTPRLPKNPDGSLRFDNAEPAIVFRVYDGDGRDRIECVDAIYEFWCFGGRVGGAHMAGDAHRVDNAMRERFRNVSMIGVPAGVIARIKNVMVGQPITDPDTQWPYVMSRYQFLIKAHR